MSTVWRPIAAAEVCGQRRGLKGRGDGVVQNEVVDLVLLSSVRRGGVEAVDFDGSVVAGGREVFVRGIEGYALDVALVVR